jgi:uncharacterized YccA/Bax inhibitor family protein
MRASNPVLSRLAEAARVSLSTTSRGDVMTRSGTAGKAVILLVLTIFSASFTWSQMVAGNTAVLMPSLLVGGIGGFITALVVSFKPNTAPVAAPIYAALQGLLLGSISALYALRTTVDGVTDPKSSIVTQAIILTFAVALGVLTLYRMNILRATEGFRRIVIGATVGIAVFYLVNIVLSMFNVNLGYTMSSSPMAIGINLLIAGVAAMNLVLNFDDIDQAVAMGAPKRMEWYGAFGLMVTLIWLYLELLRLLSRLQGRRD